MHQPIISTNTPSNDPLIKKAKQLGYKYITDLKTIMAQRNPESEDVREAVRSRVMALQISSEINPIKLISTTIPEVDDVLGGLRYGTITEFAALPGYGKTLICYKIAVKYLMDEDIANVLYITTNGSYSAERCGEIARVGCGYNESRVTSLLKRIMVLDTVDIDSLLATIQQLRSISSNYKIGLIIVDGIFIHFKDVTEVRWISVINKLLHDVKNFANVHKLPIVFTNNLTSNIDDDGNTELVCYLGEHYTQHINARIILTRENGECIAQVERPPVHISAISAEEYQEFKEELLS